MKKQDIINNKESLLEELRKYLPTFNIVQLVGSSLFFDGHDLDLIAIIDSKSQEALRFKWNDCNVEVFLYTLEERNSRSNGKLAFGFDLDPWKVTIYGDSSVLIIHDVLVDKQLRVDVLERYRRRLFERDNPHEKTLWNFLAFYYYLKNKNVEFTVEQMETLQKAHNGLLDHKDYQSYYYELKKEE
jgi:hypothetical protein